MKGMKKLQAAVLTVCLMLSGVIGISAAEVHAAEGGTFTAEITNISPDETKSINCKFKILKEPEGGNNGEVQVGDGTDSAIDTGTAGSIEIPNKVTDSTTGNTYTVTSIGAYAFDYCHNLTCTGLENNSTVTSIGERAFNNCYRLERTGLESNSTVTSIGEYAFEYCGSLTRTGLESNSTVETIGNGAFNSCSGLVSTGLESNSTVTRIGEVAFVYCYGLRSTGLESNSTVETIGYGAFAWCDSLQKVVLSEDSKVHTIEYGAFSQCDKLSSFVIKGKTVPDFGTDVFTGTGSDFAIYYPVHITNGSAVLADPAMGRQIDGSFTEGAKIAIAANPADKGKKFKDWSVDSGSVVLADSVSASTTFDMTKEAVTVTANYEDIKDTPTADGGTGGGKDNVNGTGTTPVNITRSGVPQTGDTAGIVFWMLIMLGALSVVSGFYVVRRRKRAERS